MKQGRGDQVANASWMCLSEVGNTCTTMIPFSQPSGAKEVLEGGSWLIDGRHIYLKWWSLGFLWQREVVSKVPTWVQLHNEPLEFGRRKG